MSLKGQDGCHKPLALDDIMHRLSPSPVPAPALDDIPTPSVQVTSAQHVVDISPTNQASSHIAVSTATAAPTPEDGPSSRPLDSHQQDLIPQGDRSSLGHRLELEDSGPEPLTQEGVQAMEGRLSALGYSAKTSSSAVASPRESELASMVLRLLDHYHYTSERDLSSHLASQAETILSLTTQRNILAQQYAEASDRLQSERDGWERSAEALIAQKSAASTSTKEEIVDRLVFHLQDENKRLTHKIAEQQHRLTSLESELLKLRPLLLIPPVAPDPIKRRRHSLRQSPSQNPPPASKPSRHAGPTPTDPGQATEITPFEDIPQSQESTEKSSEVWIGSQIDHPTAPTELREEPNQSASQATLVETQPPPLTASSSRTPSRDTIDPPARPPETSHSYYRTTREREQDLAIPSPRKLRSATHSTEPSTPSKYYPRAQARAASHQGVESSDTKQVMNPLWLATSASRTRAEKRATSMLCDAKAELMLAAARRIGKRRVGMAAGFVPSHIAEVEPKREARNGADHNEGGKGKERADRVERSRVAEAKGKAKQGESDQEGPATATVPVKKPARKRPLKKASTVPTATPSAAGANYYASVPGMSHLVYLNPVHAGHNIGPMPMQVGSGPNGVPVYMPISGWPPMIPSTSSAATPNTAKEKKATPAVANATPTRQSLQATPTVRRSKGQGQSQGLSSLLDAARMLEDDEISEGSGVTTPTRAGGKRAIRRMKLSDVGPPDESATTPVAKRRKVAPGTPASALSLGSPTPVQSPAPRERGSAALAKVSSALDVLADQAAQEHERRPSAGPSTRRRSPNADTQALRASTRRRQSGGRSRAANAAGSSGAARGSKQRSTAQEDPERHSSPEVSLSRKRRRSSTGVGLNSDRTRREPSVPPTEYEPSPSPVQAVPQVTPAPDHSARFSPVPSDTHGTSPSSTQQSELLSTQPIETESSPPPPATPSSDADAPGSPESTIGPET